MHLRYSEAAAEHQGEDDRVSRRGDDGKEAVRDFIGNSAGQAATLFEAVSPGNNGVGRWIIDVGVQKLVEGAKGGQPPVDCGNGVALCLAMSDVGINTADGDAVGRFVGPGEEMPVTIHRPQKRQHPHQLKTRPIRCWNAFDRKILMGDGHFLPTLLATNLGSQLINDRAVTRGRDRYIFFLSSF